MGKPISRKKSCAGHAALSRIKPFSNHLSILAAITGLLRARLFASIDLGDVGDEVEDTAGVAPLVVVPGDQLDEVVVQRDTGAGIDDGGVGVAVHVGGDDGVLGVSENA